MYIHIVIYLLMVETVVMNGAREEVPKIEIFDMTRPTRWKAFSNFYDASYNQWKICINCGIRGLGTGMHLEYGTNSNSMKPAIIPTEYLMTKLMIIDVSHLTKMDINFVLSLDVALRWITLKHDPKEPTLVVFKFNWRDRNDYKQQCVCDVPGLSYKLADWIAANLSHVVGIGTDAPTLESVETREKASGTISDVLGKSGVYMIENIYLRKGIPEHGCMTIAMPLKILEATYVPTRLTAICPAQTTDQQVAIALTKAEDRVMMKSRSHEINLNEILYNIS